jgi:hypothetical protein
MIQTLRQLGGCSLSRQQQQTITGGGPQSAVIICLANQYCFTDFATCYEWCSGYCDIFTPPVPGLSCMLFSFP